MPLRRGEMSDIITMMSQAGLKHKGEVNYG